MSDKQTALGGLVVVDLSTAASGLQATQLFADFGAEVIGVEPPGGHPLRGLPSFPFLARGRKSVVADLNSPADVAVVTALAERADLVVETFRPGVAEQFGLGYEQLRHVNPRLVYGSVTAFGRTGPYATLPAYEGVVAAKFGMMSALSEMSRRPGPTFASAPFASYPASQLLAQGLLAALYDRETSGVGQRVDTTLAMGLAVHDTFNWFARIVGKRYGGFTQVPLSANGVPSGGLSFRLLIALTKDGHWVQFSQTAARLFKAMMVAFGLDWMFTDPKWQSAPDFDDIDVRIEFWETLLTVVRQKTLAEWRVVFDDHPDVWAELFAKGGSALDHPQLAWNRQTTIIEDAALGAVRQPGALVEMSATPAVLRRSAPHVDEDGDELRARAATLLSSTLTPTGAAEQSASSPHDAARSPLEAARSPLEGVTVLELGTYYAAPFGATLLAEYGARVIKVEQLDGDPMRNMLPFPEIAGIKALQGKQSLAVDIATDAGREIVYELARRADVVLQSFRAGVAERLRVDAASLLAVNPNLVYLNAPGYGTGGPMGHRPAFAPTIGAASGLAWRNAGATIPDGPDLTLDDVKRAAMPMAQAVMGGGNCDGFASVSVGTAMMLGLLARARGAGGQEMFTSMLASATHALCDATVKWEGSPPAPTADAGLHGFHALYRLYETSDGWLFVAAPSDEEFSVFAAVADTGGTLGLDPRFADSVRRAEHDTELVAKVEALLRERSAADWESALLAAGVGGVVVAPGPIESNYLDEDRLGRELGLVTSAHHPTLDEHERLVPHVTMSRSSLVANGGCLVGQHTDEVMHWLGWTDDRIAASRATGVLGG